MNCPRDGSELQPQKYLDLDIDRCPTCKGIWLDAPELDAIEDTVMTNDHDKGTMVWNPVQSDLICPKGGEKMQTFDYRLERLMIDVCPAGHGYWLDGGEEERVLQAMRDRLTGMERSAKAESEWGGLLRKLKIRG